jgi:adenylate cyclase
VHVGEAIVSADDVIGHVVNVAARVAETAKGGQAVATMELIEAAGPTNGVIVGKPRPRRLKGIGERVMVAGVKPEPTRGKRISPGR